MLSSSLLTLVLSAGFASAAALPNALPRRTLTQDDVIMFSNDGRMEVVNKTTFAELIKGHGYNLTAPTPVLNNATTPSGPVTSGSKTVGARCSKETIFTMDPVSTFLNWDVPMSSVLKGNTADTSVAVTQGYSISNSISVGTTTSLSTIEQYLSVSLSIDYTQTWESSYSAAYTFSVPEGKYGVVVSNPATTRHSGKVEIGCVGQGETTYFQADSYSSKAYGGLSWVDGTISLCVGDTYPLPMCIGAGTLS